MTTEGALLATINAPLAVRQRVCGNFTVHYCVGGSGPTLFFIHGANIGWGMWYTILPELAKKYRVIAIDLPGAGRSTRLDYQTLNIERDFMGPLTEFFAEEIEGPVTILGSSIGGYLAIRLAEKFPARVKALALFNSVGFSSRQSVADRCLSWYPLARLISKTVLNPRLSRSRIDAFIRSTFFNKETPLVPEFLDYFFETTLTSHNLLFISRMLACSEELVVTDTAARLTIPTLVVWGEHDRIMPLEHQRAGLGRLNQSRLVVVPGVGHFPSLENPARVLEETLPFLAAHSV